MQTRSKTAKQKMLQKREKDPDNDKDVSHNEWQNDEEDANQDKIETSLHHQMS